MLISNVVRFALVCLLLVLTSSCSQDAAESELAESIELRVSSTVVVSPTNRSEGSTCVEGGVSGPQVRIWTSIRWPGIGSVDDKLIPLAMYLKIDKGSRLNSDYAQSLGAIGDTESISVLFGVTDDYLSPSQDYHSSDICFADYGSLPKPVNELTGNQQLVVRGTIQLMGVLRRNDVEVPFVKEATTKIVYVPGSVGL